MRESVSCKLAVAALFATLLAGCPDATEVGSQCAAADLVGQCPVGSNPILGAQASSACGGSFDLNVVTESGAATGQCQSNGSCEFLCQYASPCSCGIATISKESITCSECQDQSCGDGRCEGTERSSCENGATGCFACREDCEGPTCGDGDCTGSESPATCPQDCEALCTPSSKFCVGTEVHVCSADGLSAEVVDCAPAGLICGAGLCVAPGACGNHACESNESAITCPEDCGTICVPSNVSCQGSLLVTCNANGSEASQIDCASSGRVCDAGECKLPNICGNQICEAGEDVGCPADCASVCGNQECENGETNSCPQDCTTCGDRLCGANELVSCPQDCGVCVPSERFCLGKLLRVCNGNGTDFEDIDCTAFDQSCLSNNCVDPGVCGNGACESGEDLATCIEDCAVVCGDGECQTDSESFATCSQDCAPQCGDAACQGDEDFMSCPLDCLATCGNEVCDGGEDRDSCQKDCGYCGNGVCEDAAESASLFPSAPLVTCLEDCVTSGCEQDGDCNDGIFCTTGDCNSDHVCQYTAMDDLCPVNEKCIKFSGCCPDKDRDGYADMACGGSDCNDDDNLVYPGAIEACGGGDRNCNGFHRPALKPIKKVTTSSSRKSALDMTWDGTRFWAAWRGVPEATARVELARISQNADLIGNIDAVPLAVPKPTGLQIAWSEQTKRLGVAWEFVSIDGKSRANFTTVGDNGALSPDPLIVFESPSAGMYANPGPILSDMVWLDGIWVIADGSYYGTGGAGISYPWGWLGATESGDVTRRFPNDYPAGYGSPMGVDPLVVAGTQVAGLQGTRIFKVTPGDVTGAFTIVNIGPDAAKGACTMVWDGENLALACLYLDQLTYHRLAANGAALASSIIYDTALTPRSMATAIGGLSAGDTTKVGILGVEGANLVFVMRDADGSAVVEPGTIGGGAAIADPRLFWDGDGFQAFWLAKSGEIEQLFRAIITCE